MYVRNCPERPENTQRSESRYIHGISVDYLEDETHYAFQDDDKIHPGHRDGKWEVRVRERQNAVPERSYHVLR